MWGIALIVVSLLFNFGVSPQKGTTLRMETYRGYPTPILADGRGGEVRMMKDVLWEVLPIETRLRFATRNGGHLCIQDLLDAWEAYGEWKRPGMNKSRYIQIGELWEQ